MSKPALSQKILDTLKTVLPAADTPIPLHEPSLEGNEWQYVKASLDSRFVSSVGEYVDEFERKLEAYTGAKRAVAVVNGTAGLHAALILTGVQPGDEVMLPALTFVATANAVTYIGAIPHFADCEDATLCIDPDKLAEYLESASEQRTTGTYNRQTGRRIAAVIPMHAFGHPADLDKLRTVCEAFQIAMVEDAAEAVGTFYRDRHVGNDGTCSILSFNGNKIITTGGGGAILTNDIELGRRAKHLTTTAKAPHRWHFVHDQVGYNYRMPNINAALGCAQMEQLPHFVSRKRALARRYAAAFQKLPETRFIREPAYGTSNYWLNTILLENAYRDELEAVLEHTNRNGCLTRPIWTPMHHLPMFKTCPKMDLHVTENIVSRALNIPSGANL